MTINPAAESIARFVRPPYQTLDADDAARKAYRRMEGDSVRSLVIVDGERYVGIVAWRTIRQLSSAELGQPVANFVDPAAPTLKAGMTISEAMAVFHATDVATLGLLPVVGADGKLEGLIEREEFQGLMEDATGTITVPKDPVAHLLTGPDVPRPGAQVISSDGENLGIFLRHVEDRGRPRWIEVEHGRRRRKRTRYVPLISIAHQSRDEIVLNIDADMWRTFVDRPIEEKLRDE